MKVVVTGGSGRVGRHASEALAASGHDVLAIDRAAAPSDAYRTVAIDLADIRDLARAFRGADALIHMARVPFPYASAGYDTATRTWSKPDVLGDAERYNLNTAMTYNVLAAASASGIRRVVLGSSLAVYGLYYPSRAIVPDYLPIDEAHPRRPDDPYGLTKLVGEELADAFARTGAMQIASLRFPVVFAGNRDTFLAEQGTAIRGHGAFWTYIDARDAARACQLALETALDGHQAFNICASKTLIATPTGELIRKYLPEVTDIRNSDSGNWAGYDAGKAEMILGFTARHLLLP